jgi:hypothetical protein
LRIGFQDWCDDFVEELVNLLLGSSGILFGCEYILDVDFGKSWVMGKKFEQVVWETLLFDSKRGGLAVYSDHFVEFLAISAGSDTGPHEGFGGHEREFFG